MFANWTRLNQNQAPPPPKGPPTSTEEPWTPEKVTKIAPANLLPMKTAQSNLQSSCASSSSRDPSAFLPKVPLFKSLPPSDLPKIAQAMETRSYNAKDLVFRQGDKGDAFYIIQSGEASVQIHEENFLKVGDQVRCIKDLYFGGKRIPKGAQATVDKFDPSREYPYTIRVRDGGQRGRILQEEVALLTGSPEEKTVATLRPGDYFGEQALLKSSNRQATIIAETPLVTFCLTREKFKGFQLGEKLHFVKRKAVMAFEEDSPHKQHKTVHKTSEEVDFIKRALRANKNLSNLVNLTDTHLERLAAVAYKENVAKSTVVIQHGDLFADRFYIVKSGEFTFSLPSSAKDDKMSYSKFLGESKEGSTFGELALLYHAPRAATVTCQKDGVLWVIDRAAFKNVIMAANDKKMADYLEIINHIEVFNILMQDEKTAVAEALVEKNFIRGEHIIRQGENGDAFYILFDGKVDVVKDGTTVNTLEAKSKEKKAHWFGERALLRSEPRAASIVAVSDEAQCVILSRENFESLLGTLEGIMLESNNASSLRKTRVFQGVPRTRPSQMNSQIRMEDLRSLGLLGCGGFGAVTLEQHKVTGKAYALKALSKGYIVKMRMQKGVLREKEILSMCDSNFICRLYATFKTADKLFFLLEPAMGGELFATYHKHRFHGSVSKAKFYSASVVFAFEHLHARNVLYRDLKPENLLLDHRGFCKLTDMGLAKVVVGKTYTTCGTPDYFAPEVVQQSGMTKAVDWWTLGILIHELLSGHAPFEASDPMETYQKIVRGVGKVSFPYKDRDSAGVDLVTSMLKHNASERLPMRAGGTKNLKQHAWYHGFHWDLLMGFQFKPPYVPKVQSPTDMSNFRANESDLPPSIPYKNPGTGWDDNF
eukprot:GEMP01002491.1.p1 GENE.GEMP01002491.1~~GEMP01002491.1.p1  ORF type:complete len:878 (+),score=255.93 GEMP01002491.1:437-3070(+)